MLKLTKRNGQGTVEYLLLLAAVIVVVLFALREDGFVTQRTNKALDLATMALEDMAEETCFREDEPCD